MQFPIKEKFKLSEGFIEKYKSQKPNFGFGGLGEFVFMRCVSVETPILCSDFTWRKAGDMRRGDEIISFDEFPDEKTKERYIRLGKITHNKIEKANVLGIQMEDGEILYCTPEHRWLAKTSKGLQWVFAKDLMNTKSFEISLPKWAEVTHQDNTYMSGYLAGAFDGEASLDRAVGISFIQVENEMLENVKTFLDHYGFSYTFKEKKAGISLSSFKSNKKIYSVILYRKEQLIKFFSLVKPKRLISNFINKIKEGKLSLRMEKENYVKVVRVFDAGERDIAVISTSTKTHFTSGYPSHNTYSRLKPDGKNEAWFETVRRVVEGIYSIQKQHIEDYRLGWNQSKAQKSAQEMYDRIFNFKMLGSGRAFWALGTDIVTERGLTESLYNCSFISSLTMKENASEPFMNAMDFLMLGVGVGFDTRGAGSVIAKEPREKEETHIVTDDREGWVKSTGLCIESFFGGINYVFDYSQIRKAGEPIRTFGGVSSGYKPLKQLHDTIKDTLSKNIGNPITETSIADIINAIGVAVVSGNVRRSAELLVGSNTEEFLDLKNYKKNKERSKIGWASNNSIDASIGMDYSDIAKRIVDNGEPGVLWIDNMKKYGRMRESENTGRDHRVIGVNPCAEITLEDRELCNLVEIIPSNHEDVSDFHQTIKYAYLFAKTITLLNTNWSATNKVMLRNRRIGLSLTGITQFIAEHGIKELKEWMETGYDLSRKYDKVYSEWFAVPESIKITTVKPSGTLSLLAGVTPGIHFPESRNYIRRVRLSKNSPYVKVLKNSNYHVEDASEDPENTVVVEFPVSLGDKVKTINESNLWEQMSLASFAQENWADNAVSVTVTFKKSEASQIESALQLFQFRMKSVSFLPKLDGETPYKQMPYEEITESQYKKMVSKLSPLDFSDMLSVDSNSEMYCESDVCMVL